MSAVSPERRLALITQYQTKPGDTGSPSLSRGIASFSWKGPTRMRRSAAMCPTVPQARARSRARERI